MAQERVATGDEGGKQVLEWQKERFEVTELVGTHILDPIMVFTEFLRGYDQEKGVAFNSQEISAILRLLVLGGYAEMKTYSTFGGSLCYKNSEMLDIEYRKWLEAE